LFPGQAPVLTAAEDADATNVFREAERLAREAGVPLQLIYATSDSPAEVILDSAATYAADQVILGISRRAAVMRALRGDVIETVAANLPEESTLLIHA
ncbi:MAG: universal stress protein, partial [Deltaproteobacteria bacterium]|nr:universal stress protein [Deltaproteobacteria bacterium]